MIDAATLIRRMSKVAFSLRKTLPQIPCVYAVFSEEGSVLYVGQSQNLHVRWAGHHREKDLLQYERLTIAWLIVLDKEERIEVERALVEQLCPVLNNVEKWWVSGRAKFTEGKIVRRQLLLSAEQDAWLRKKENASAYLRQLIDRERAKPLK